MKRLSKVENPKTDEHNENLLMTPHSENLNTGSFSRGGAKPNLPLGRSMNVNAINEGMKSSTGDRKTRRERKERGAVTTLLNSMSQANKGIIDEVGYKIGLNANKQEKFEPEDSFAPTYDQVPTMHQDKEYDSKGKNNSHLMQYQVFGYKL
jgi:hypothetical protein